MKCLIYLTLILFVFIGCNQDDSESETESNNSNNTETPAFVYTNLVFNLDNPFFATDGSMSAPISSNEAQLVANTIDITFIWNIDYDEPGFFDPIARSQDWYWDEYRLEWLNVAKETRFYSTDLTTTEFNNAKNDQSLIGTYFENDPSFDLAPHGIFPAGSCIGGRQTTDPQSIDLFQSQVFGFENTSTGKRGLLMIRNDQYSFWPVFFVSDDTKVDLIREQ